LIGDYPFVHNGAHDAKNSIVEEELRRKAGRIERHWQKVTMLTPVWLVMISLHVVHENWPKGFTATLH
jgi:hypothetical protein